MTSFVCESHQAQLDAKNRFYAIHCATREARHIKLTASPCFLSVSVFAFFFHSLLPANSNRPPDLIDSLVSPFVAFVWLALSGRPWKSTAAHRRFLKQATASASPIEPTKHKRLCLFSERKKHINIEFLQAFLESEEIIFLFSSHCL
ncbi:hypothetical protein V8C26DRAFT_225556 [Trichoderma gracile]